MINIPDNCAIIAVSTEGMRTALQIIERGFKAQLYLPCNLVSCTRLPAVNFFDCGVLALTDNIFTKYNGFVYIMPLGIVVRATAPLLKDKYTDPAIVTVDVGGRWAIATLSGHEGGANNLAAKIAGYLYCEPVITTSTEAAKTIIAGIGCGKGVTAVMIDNAVNESLNRAGYTFDNLRIAATVDVKEHEKGILEFCENHRLHLRIINRREILYMGIKCAESAFVMKTIGIGSVAEPCALLAGSRTRLVLKKQIFNRVTVALAVEHTGW